MSNENQGRLYGIVHSNRNGEDLWGKNQFNSTFPIALSCYMRDEGKTAVVIEVGAGGKVKNSSKSFDEVFGTKCKSDELFFNFESRFSAFESLIYGPLERVDCVVSLADKDSQKTEVVEGKQVQPLEVKLTVVPDNSSFERAKKEWGAEIVIRPATTKYCALSMAFGCRTSLGEVRSIFDAKLNSVRDWGNEVEALTILPTVLDCLETFEKKFHKAQKPLVLQPIWQTAGKSPILAEEAFDVFVWTNFALTRMIIDQAKKGVGKRRVSRPARSALRLAKFLLDFCRGGKAHIDNIFDGMTFGYQSDKEFSVNGGITRQYMTDKRVHSPQMKRSIVDKIILEGGIDNLSPERRFDQSIYFLSRYDEK